MKADIKATLEDGVDPSKPQGNRNWVQVLSNSLPSLVAALAYSRYVSVSEACFSIADRLQRHPVSSVLDDSTARSLIYACVFHFATSLGDTLASELGILSASPPVSILTLKKVPPGTNGGISKLGLLWSTLGGTVMGIATVGDLLIESTVSASQGARLVGYASFAGLFGSLVSFQTWVPIS